MEGVEERGGEGTCCVEEDWVECGDEARWLVGMQRWSVWLELDWWCQPGMKRRHEEGRRERR